MKMSDKLVELAYKLEEAAENYVRQYNLEARRFEKLIWVKNTEKQQAYVLCMDDESIELVNRRVGLG